jgi:hypothetical protein
MPSFEGKPLNEALYEKSGIGRIETVFSVVFKKTDAEVRGDGALNISINGDLDMRVYSLGFLAMELSSHEGRIRSNPRLDINKKIILTKGLRNSLFWWDIKNYTVTEENELYLMKNSQREVWISKKTLLPEKQKVYFESGRILVIYYDNPAQEKDIWYQSKMRIELSRYAVILTLKKISFQS